MNHASHAAAITRTEAYASVARAEFRRDDLNLWWLLAETFNIGDAVNCAIRDDLDVEEQRMYVMGRRIEGPGMSRHALPCIVCAKPLRNIDEGDDNQPGGGTEFTTTGHYGSTIIDHIDDTDPMTFVVNICDTCILRALDADVIQSRSERIVLSHHPVEDWQRAWVLAQNEKRYGSAWGDDKPVDYRAKMLEAGWPEHMIEEEER